MADERRDDGDGADSAESVEGADGADSAKGADVVEGADGVKGADGVEGAEGGLEQLRRLLGDERLCRTVRAWADAERLPGAAAAVAARVAPPGPGLVGFLGAHARVELRVRDGGGATHTARLFVKTVPCDNQHKADFIDEGDFFRREALVYELLGQEGAGEWRPRAFLCDERAAVLADLAPAGCATRPARRPFDLPHARLAAAALARLHAAVAALEEARGADYCSLRDHGAVLREPSLRPGPWLAAGASLVAALLREFGGARACARPGLDAALRRQFERACATLRHEPGALNVLLHRDCWANNVLFEYAGERPRRALLIDFQCARYGPPAFDVALMLYLTTDAQFRRAHWAAVRRHYWAAWRAAAAAGGGGAARRARRLRYDRAEFSRRCSEARMFALAAACCICPYVLMAGAAARCFAEPGSFRRLTFEDRRPPVLAHARADPVYRERLLELADEFLQKYITDEDIDETIVT